MSNPKPQFDPTQPYQAASPSEETQKPAFDPSQPFQAAPLSTQKPAFDPSQSFEDIESPAQMALTAKEGVERGFTAGLSDVIAKHPILNTIKNVAESSVLGPLGSLVDSSSGSPEEIEARKEANPGIALTSNLVGTAGLLTATDGLGFPALAEKIGLSGIKALAAEGAAQGFTLGAANSASNDLAFGDPSANASKILTHAGLSGLIDAGTAGITSTLLGVAGKGIPAALQSARKFLQPSEDTLTLSPDAIGPLDKIRIGLFAGHQDQAAEKIVNGLRSLNEISALKDDLSSSADPTQLEHVEKFAKARSEFLSHFGNDQDSIDPDKVMSFITNPAAKSSAKQTVAFNNFFKSVESLKDLKFTNSTADAALKTAQQNLQDWTDLIGDANFFGPKQSSFTTLLKGTPEETRVGDFGNEEVSPFETPDHFKLGKIQAKINQFQDEVYQLQKAKSEANPEALSSSVNEASGASRTLSHLSNANEGFRKAPAPMPAIFDVAEGLAIAHLPITAPLFALFHMVRNYAGEGGLYRMGSDLASPLKILEGTGNVIQKIDDRIGDGARLIFTGASAQAHRVVDQGGD